MKPDDLPNVTTFIGLFIMIIFVAFLAVLFDTPRVENIDWGSVIISTVGLIGILCIVTLVQENHR